MTDHADYIQDAIVVDWTDLNRNMMLSIDILNVPTDEAMREVETRSSDHCSGGWTRGIEVG